MTSDVLWHLPLSNFTVCAQTTILYNEFTNYTFEIMQYLPGANELILCGPIATAISDNNR